MHMSVIKSHTPRTIKAIHIKAGLGGSGSGLTEELDADEGHKNDKAQSQVLGSTIRQLQAPDHSLQKAITTAFCIQNDNF